MTQEGTCNAAIGYAEMNWVVLPLYGVSGGRCSCGRSNCTSPGKHPHAGFAPHGLKNATIDGPTICSWYANGELVNLGVRTGPESGIVVLDVDDRHGGSDTLAALGNLPDTATVQTGGGRHLYFTYPAGADIRNSAGKLGPGLDIRAGGGYVVAPPSMHVSGARYAWLRDPRGGLADLPQSIIQRLTPTGVNPPAAVGNVIPVGARDDTLTSLAGTMRRRGMSEASILAALRSENDRCEEPLDDADLRRISRSIGTRPVPETCGAVYRRFDTIQREQLVYTWHNRIARRKLNCFGGDPDIGKSILTTYAAATITTGGYWPEAQMVTHPEEMEYFRARQGNVIILSAEDEPEDTIGPRFDAAGGDSTRFYVLDSVKDEKGKRGFSLATDLAHLEAMIREIGGVEMVVLDPLSAYMGRATDTYKDSEVRSILSPFATMAQEYDFAGVYVSHLNKKSGSNYKYRLSGSLGLFAAARMAWMVVEDEDSEDEDVRRGLILPGKANVVAREGIRALAYTIESSPINGSACLRFDDTPPTISTREALEDGQVVDRSGAAKWLRAKFKNDWTGPIASEDVYAAAEDAGYPRRTIRRIRAQIGATVTSRGFSKDRVAIWAPPGVDLGNYDFEALDAIAEEVRQRR